MAAFLLPRAVPLKETKVGTVFAIALSLVSMAVLAVCLSRRVQNVRDWARLPLVCWLILIIYVDSIAFVSGTALLSNGFGIDTSKAMCSRAILLCLGCYMTTKLIYYFLVERVYIIRRSPKPRLKDPLYMFNSIFMLIPYCVVIVLNFWFRFATYQNGTCAIGMKRVAMIPLIGFDILVNVYLTSLFLIPLRGLYSYKTNPSSQARTLALRTFIGSCCTLISSVVNLTVLMVLNGEPGWICLMCCNVDILFSVLVLHWITSKDNVSTKSPSQSFGLEPPMSPGGKRLVARPPVSDTAALELSLRQYSKGHQITTEITAGHDKDDSSEFEQVNTYPKKAITVEKCHYLEVIQAGPDRKSQISMGDADHRAVRTGSTDELFRKS